MNYTIPDICSCDDSPLSYTGNITGILTFTLGLLVSLIAFFSMIRNASTEIQKLTHIVDETDEHIIQMVQHLGRLELRRINQNFVEMKDLLMGSLGRFSNAQVEAATYLKTFNKGGLGGSTASLLTRIRWWYVGMETAAYMAGLEIHNQRVAAVQLTFLLL